jgi:hypothetical protein
LLIVAGRSDAGAAPGRRIESRINLRAGVIGFGNVEV